MDRKRPPELIMADDDTESVGLLLRLRLPWLVAGLGLGLCTTLIIARFEAVLASDVRLAFFIPVIVYMSAAVGAQTQEIFVRNMADGRVYFTRYVSKELALGLIMGTVLGGAMFGFAYLWLRSVAVATSVGLAMSLSIATATLIGLFIPRLLSKEHQDPAVGAAPVTTVIQDFVSLLIYLLIATAIIL